MDRLLRIVLRFVFGALLVGMGAGCAWAQPGDQLMVMAGDSALACLDTGGGKQPAYPERELVLKTEAIVRVSLTFVAPDRPPSVQTTYNSGGDVFTAAVKDFVKSYRLPCMAAGAPPVVGVQEFQFVPHDGRQVIYGALRDGRPIDPKAFRCVAGMRPPTYPLLAGLPLEGTVVVQLKFVDNHSPPVPKVIFNGGSDRLAAAVLAAVESYRMPCLGTADAPLTAMQSFSFVMSDSKRWALKDLQLSQFVAAIDKPERAKVRFDFSSMGCPFDVRLRLFQPHTANQVGELERSDPNRREFIEWLRTVSLQLPADAARQVIGQSITISVPCGVLDLS